MIYLELRMNDDQELRELTEERDERERRNREKQRKSEKIEKKVGGQFLLTRDVYVMVGNSPNYPLYI